MTITETSPRTVVVTGANGMVGRHLTGLLLERGDRVIALVRDPEHAQLPDGVELRRWQASDLAAPLYGADAVVNLVGPHLCTALDGRPQAGTG